MKQGVSKENANWRLSVYFATAWQVVQLPDENSWVLRLEIDTILI